MASKKELLEVLNEYKRLFAMRWTISINHKKVDRKPERWTEKVDRKGGQETRDAILQMIREDAHISSSKMAERLGINRSAVSKHLKKMQDTGVIRREGPDKGGKWVIIK